MAVDLDGTLVEGNTLHIFIRTALRSAGFAKAVKIYAWLALRALRLVSHSKMKFAVLKNIDVDEKLFDRFKSAVEARKRPEVLQFIEQCQAEGCRVVLATAAPDVYIPQIWDGEFVATQTYDNAERLECRGSVKLQRLEALKGDNGVLSAVVTDHFDDLPLLLSGARRNILVSPSAKTLRKVREKGVPFEIMRPNV